MKVVNDKFICDKAHEITSELWGTDHLLCFGNLEIKMQEIIKTLLNESDKT